MNILGLSCYYHDSAACLIKDGKLVAAVQEERFNRVKNSSDFPINAINFRITSYNVCYTKLLRSSYPFFPNRPGVEFD